ncbi:hypothetical protein Tco_0666633, partial [Tanacetum coccineum]
VVPMMVAAGRRRRVKIHNRMLIPDRQVSLMVAAGRRRLFLYSDTVRLSRSDEVLKLKNFKKDATLKLFKSTNQVRYEHVGPEVASPQDGKVTRWRRDCAWLMISSGSRSQCQIQVQGTSSIQKSMITTTYSQENVKRMS